MNSIPPIFSASSIWPVINQAIATVVEVAMTLHVIPLSRLRKCDSFLTLSSFVFTAEVICLDCVSTNTIIIESMFSNIIQVI